jgi:serine/threonine protein kinase/signal transduction histidine kinase/tetratricopeptide (TPR) repeat protein
MQTSDTASDVKAGGSAVHQPNDTTPKTNLDETRLPENLGHYRVTRLIGRGGMGSVYKAICESTHETVAIKTLRVDRESSASSEQVRRFRQEAEFLSRTQHPNIVHFIDFGMEEDSLFLVMEYVEGQTLKSYLQRHDQLPLKTFLDIAIQVAEVINALQSNGLVHRDIKPQNIMLAPALGMDLVKVLDFGISTLSPELSQRSANDGYIMGTVTYSSPEQSGMTDSAVDNRSDLYSLGVVFFEMLAGSPPFLGDAESITYQHLSTEPPSLRSMRGDVPEALSNIVAKLLQKSPQDRYQTGFGLMHDLKECRRQISAGEQEWQLTIGSYDHFQGLHFTSRLIGRDRHSQALQKSIEIAKSGNTHVVQILGELGIGKSFLISDFHLRAVQQHCVFLSCRLQRMAFDCGLQPLVQTLDTYLMQLLRSSETRRHKVFRLLSETFTSHVIALLRSIHSAREVVAQMVDLSPNLLEQISQTIEERPRDLSDTQSQYALRKALFALFLEIARLEECLVLEIDCLHWADEELFSFIEELTINANKQACKLLCIFTASFENPEGAEGIQRLVHRLRRGNVYVHQVLLEPFSLDDVRDFVSEIITDSPESINSLSETLHAFTKGNPLFLREALKSMVVYGNLVFDTSVRHWRYMKRDLSNLQLPVDVVDLIIERTKPFSNETKLILSTAARLGSSFSRQTLEKVLPEMQQQLDASLSEALNEHLVTERDGKFAFAHSKIREFFLIRLDQSEASDIHFRILSFLNETPFDDQVTALREYAHHAYSAGPRTNPELSCAACALLAIAEEDLGELQRSQEQLQRALEIAKSSRSSRLHDSVVALEIQLADLLRRLGHSGKAQRLLELALEGIGARVTAFPQDLLFSALAKLQTVKLMRGETLRNEYADQNLEEISLSILRSELDRIPTPDNTETILDFARTVMNQNQPEKNDRTGESGVSTTMAATFAEIERGLEDHLRNIVEHPHGLAQLLLKTEQRSRSAVQFLVASHPARKNPEVSEILGRLWEIRKDLFLSLHPDLLWTVWLEEISSEKTRTEMMLVLEDILDTIAATCVSFSNAARVFSLCIRALFAWQELEIREVQALEQELRATLESGRNTSAHYCSIWGLLTRAKFLFLRGEWDELVKVVEEALADAEHLDYPSIATECMAYHAALGTLRDCSKLESVQDNIKDLDLRPRVTALLKLATLFDDFASKPIESTLELASRQTGMTDSLWVRTNPLIAFGNFLALSTRISSVCDGRSGSALTANALLSKLRNEVDAEFPESASKGYYALFRTLLLHGVECAHGNHDEMRSGFFSAESDAMRSKISPWLTISRIQTYRIKISEARKRESQMLADEASVHLVCAERFATEAGFLHLSESLSALANSLSQSDEMSVVTSEKSLSQGITTIMGRLKIDRVFAYSTMLLTKQTIDELLQPALEAFIELTGAQRGAIMLRDRVATTYTLKALFGVPHTSDVFQRVVLDSVSDTDFDLPISWSVITRVRAEGRIIIVHNAQTDECIANQFSVVKNHIRSVLGMPLVHNDEVLGILYLDSCLLNDLFNRDSVKLMHPLVRQLAFIVSNIWLKKSSEEAYLALKQSQKHLIQSEKMAGIGTMAASVAHDFRTPLSIIMGLTEDIRELLNENEISSIGDNVDRILSAAKKLQRLVQSMQDFSRKSTRELGPVDLGKILDEVLFLTEKKIKQGGVELVLSVENDLPSLCGNANELEQVLMNLINNAVDAMEKAPTKRLRVTAALRSDGAVEVQVSDSGCGIPDAERRNIFQPFFTTKPVGKGTGLGLSIVNTLIQGQHGSIRFESAPDQGTTFIIVLPSIDKTGNVLGRQQIPSNLERPGG